MQMPEVGDAVTIAPTPEHCPKGATRSNVIADPHSGRFMSVAGEQATWSAWHVERLRQGEIRIVRPATPAAAKPEEK